MTRQVQSAARLLGKEFDFTCIALPVPWMSLVIFSTTVTRKRVRETFPLSFYRTQKAWRANFDHKQFVSLGERRTRDAISGACRLNLRSFSKV